MKADLWIFARQIRIHCASILRRRWLVVALIAPFFIGLTLLVRLLIGAAAAEVLVPNSELLKTVYQQLPKMVATIQSTFAGSTISLDTLSLSGKLVSSRSIEVKPDGRVATGEPILGFVDGALQSIKGFTGSPDSKGWAPSRIWIVGYPTDTLALSSALGVLGASPQNAAPSEIAKAMAGASPRCSEIAIEVRNGGAGLDFVLEPGASFNCRAQVAVWARKLSQSWWFLAHPPGFGEARIYTPMTQDGLAAGRAEWDAMARAAADKASLDAAMRFLLTLALFELAMILGSISGMGWIVEIERGAMEPFAATGGGSWLIFGPCCAAQALWGVVSATLGIVLCEGARWALSSSMANHGKSIYLPNFEWGGLASSLALFFFAFLFSSLHAVLASVVVRGWALRFAFGLAGPVVANLLFFSGSAWSLAWKTWQLSSDAELAYLRYALAAAAGSSTNLTWILLALACASWMALLSWMIDRRRWIYLLGKGKPS